MLYLLSVVAVRLLIAHLSIGSHLATSASTSEAPIWAESEVPVEPDLLFVDCDEVKSIDCNPGFLSRLVFHEAKAAWLKSNTIKAHMQVFDGATCREKLSELSLLGVVAEVTHVKSCRRGQPLSIIFLRKTRATVIVFRFICECEIFVERCS